jgi:tetratricopeptide (TPR) repeat protein
MRSTVTAGLAMVLPVGLMAVLSVHAQELPAAQQVSTSIPQPASVASAAPTPAPLTPEKRGDVYMARKMYREAIEAYSEALRVTANPVVWNKMGIAYHQLMELDTAKRHYETAIKLNREYAEAINNLGALYYAKKNYRRAIKEYRKALKINPNSASIYSNLGTAYFARKKYKDAFEAYQKALALDPEIFEHRSTYGVMLQERSVEERARFYYFLAKTYANAGMTDRALLYVRKALEEGFKERKKFLEEPEFASLQEVPEFKELMASPPRAL